MKRKWISIILLCAMLIFTGMSGVLPGRGGEELSVGEDAILRIWYTDDELTEYIKGAAVAYREQTGITVIPVLQTGVEYVESINEATLRGTDGPDVYLLSNDSIEKAHLSGLACEISDSKGILNTNEYPQTALDAVTYCDKLVGYPLDFETSVFLYNDTFLTTIAEQAIRSQLEMEAGEAAMDDLEENGAEGEVQQTSEGEHIENAAIDEALILQKKGEILPKSVVGILSFANSYDPPETVETFFKWDISDVIFNYWFAGAYMNLGGQYGDNREEISLYNEKAMYCLSIYQDFNQFFSIEADEVAYEDILQEFEAGKVMFTVATTDAVKRLEEAKEQGQLTYEYGIAPIGMVNDTLETGALSITNAVMINGYSSKIEAANDFASFLTYDYAQNLFSRSGKISARYFDSYPYPTMENVMECYEQSISIPKMVESSNYWILAELCYANIWNGSDVNTSLKQLSEQIGTEITGTEVIEEEIETPTITEDYIQSE